MKFRLERKQGASTYYIHYDGTNSKGEKLLIELSKCKNSGGDKSIPALWKKHGYTKEVMETWWSVHTYVEDKYGNTWGIYNPQHIEYFETYKGKFNGCRYIIDFDYIWDATEDNAKKLLEICEDWFLNCRKNKTKLNGEMTNEEIIDMYKMGGFRERYAMDVGKRREENINGNKCYVFEYSEKDEYQDGNGATYDTVRKQWIN